MACRAVLFALAEDEAKRLLDARSDEALEEAVEEIEERWDEEWLCELDKAWDGIHRALTDGELAYDNGEYPLNHAILGGQQLYEGDDYIIAFVQAAQVADVAKALEGIRDAQFRERYFKINRENYGAAPKQVSEEDFEYVAGWFEELKAFYAKAAAAGRAVVFTVDQ